MADPGGRVYKDKADEAKQKAMEGKNTPFQKALRAAEAAGKTRFMFNGKPYAANPAKSATKMGKPVETKKAVMGSLGPMPGTGKIVGMKKKGSGGTKKTNVGRMAKKFAPKGRVNKKYFN